MSPGGPLGACSGACRKGVRFCGELSSEQQQTNHQRSSHINLSLNGVLAPSFSPSTNSGASATVSVPLSPLSTCHDVFGLSVRVDLRSAETPPRAFRSSSIPRPGRKPKANDGTGSSMGPKRAVAKRKTRHRTGSIATHEVPTCAGIRIASSRQCLRV